MVYWCGGTYLSPGVKFEIVPILSGAQGIGKSTLINKLAPDFSLTD